MKSENVLVSTRKALNNNSRYSKKDTKAIWIDSSLFWIGIKFVLQSHNLKDFVNLNFSKILCFWKVNFSIKTVKIKTLWFSVFRSSGKTMWIYGKLNIPHLLGCAELTTFLSDWSGQTISFDENGIPKNSMESRYIMTYLHQNTQVIWTNVWGVIMAWLISKTNCTFVLMRKHVIELISSIFTEKFFECWINWIISTKLGDFVVT